MPIISALGRQRQADFCVPGQPGLYRETLSWKKEKEKQMTTIQYKPSVLPLFVSLQTQLPAPPAVPDFVTSFHLNPLRDRMILLLFLGQKSLDSESLVRRHFEKPDQAKSVQWQRRLCLLEALELKCFHSKVRVFMWLINYVPLHQ